MQIAMIAAMAHDRVIGRDNGLPWHLPEDLRHFRRLTLGKPVVMGRKTYESIGKPLPGRHCIVISRQPDWQAPGVDVVHAMDDAINLARQVLKQTGGDEAIIMGGAEVYRQAMPLASRLYLTEIDLDIEGDAWFPLVDAGQWQQVSRQPGLPEANSPDYAFVVYQRL